MIYNLCNHIQLENTKLFILYFAKLDNSNELIKYIDKYNYPKLSEKENQKYINENIIITKPEITTRSNKGKKQHIIFNMYKLVSILNKYKLEIDSKLSEFLIEIK